MIDSEAQKRIDVDEIIVLKCESVYEIANANEDNNEDERHKRSRNAGSVFGDVPDGLGPVSVTKACLLNGRRSRACQASS